MIVKVPAPANESNELTSTRDSTAPSAPSVKIGNGDEWIAKNEIDADGKVDITVSLPADAKEGDTLIVNGVEHKITQAEIDSPNKEAIVKLPAPQEDKGVLTVTATIKDQAGNESDESDPATATRDKSLDIIKIQIGDGDEFISSYEFDETNHTVDVTFILPKTAKEGDILEITQKVEGEDSRSPISHTLTADDINAGKVIKPIRTPNVDKNVLEVTAEVTHNGQAITDVATAQATQDIKPTDNPKVIIANGDEHITTDEINNNEVEVTIILPTKISSKYNYEKLQVGDKLIINGVERQEGLTQAEIDAGKIVIKRYNCT